MPSRRSVLAALIGGTTSLAALRFDTARAQARPIRVVALGDSLTAGLGLPNSQAFPAQLERALRARGRAVEVVNAGVSGDTAAGGRDRLDWSVPDDADAVIVELGANDALRGLDVGRMEAALDAILTRLAERRLPTLLAGMLAPRSLGQDYVQAYDAVFPRLARRHAVVFHPFFLDGVAGDPALNLPDGIHPNARGVAVIVERILPAVDALLARVPPR